MSPVCAPGYPDSLRVQRDPRTGRYANFGGVQAPSPWRIFRWLLRLGPKERPAVDPARVPAGAAPCVAPDLARIAAPPADAMQFTWVGHSTWLIQVGGLNILTDPIWSQHCAPVPWPTVRRRTPPGVSLEQLPRIDLVLLSHSHYDHCDVPTLRRLGTAPAYVVPAGLGPLVQRCTAGRVHEAEWGETIAVGGAKLTAVPALHFSARKGPDRNVTLWCGWLLEVAGRRIYFAGDTGMAPFFGELGAWFRASGGIDVALLPIGAYQPRWVMTPVHCTAADAVDIHRSIGVKQSLAMHWGTFVLTEEPLREPPVLLADTLLARGVPEELFRTLAVGETVAFV
jgi:N-acyl-phosphatidylethanolamine-hydrolysing phospholipase D